MTWRYDPDVPLRFVRGVSRVSGPVDSCHRMMHTELCPWELGPSDRLRLAVSKQKDEKKKLSQTVNRSTWISFSSGDLNTEVQFKHRSKSRLWVIIIIMRNFFKFHSSKQNNIARKTTTKRLLPSHVTHIEPFAGPAAYTSSHICH